MKDGDFEKLLYGLEYEAYAQGKCKLEGIEDGIYNEYQKRIFAIQQMLIDEYNRLNDRIKELEDNNEQT